MVVMVPEIATETVASTESLQIIVKAGQNIDR